MRLEILQEIQEYSQWLFDDWADGISSSDFHTPIRSVLLDHGIKWDEIGETWQDFCRTAVRNGIAAATE
jgi:hypothetical protein